MSWYKVKMKDWVNGESFTFTVSYWCSNGKAYALALNEFPGAEILSIYTDMN